MDIHPHSSFPTQPDTLVTLESFIRGIGLGLPTNHFSLTALADAVSERAVANPFGNFGGALSWPVPLNTDDQRTLQAAALQYIKDHSNTPETAGSLGILEFLNGNNPLSSEAKADPIKALESILNGPRGLAFGRAMQVHMKGIDTDTSPHDYALAAINLVLNPQTIPDSQRNQVAGFDLAQSDHWGLHPSAVVDALVKRLIKRDLAGPETAKVAAMVLLAQAAPAFQVKGIPDNVTYGSPAWTRLEIAVAIQEAESPGSAATMGFDEIMIKAEKATQLDPAVTELAQKTALVDWGVVNGLTERKDDKQYTDQELDELRAQYNQEFTEQIDAQALSNTEIPSRKDIALAKLKERFGEGIPFERPLLKLQTSGHQSTAMPLYDPNLRPEGYFSMLDIAMMENRHYTWKTDDPRIPLAEINKNPVLGVNAAFKQQFDEAIVSRKQGLSATVRHLISKLPLEQRKDLEYGKLRFFHESEYRLNLTDKTLLHKYSTFSIKTERDDVSSVYEVDIQQGTITKLNSGNNYGERNYGPGSRHIQRTEFRPSRYRQESQKENTGDTSVTPKSFSSDRSQYIADAFVEHLDIDNADVVKAAKGSTQLDKQFEAQDRAANFFLDLVPLRSAIVNFISGNYVAGALDLTMDVLGFLTAGAATAAKLVKVGAIAGSAATKLAKGARVIGAATLSAFNPLGGADDLVFGGARLLGKSPRALEKGIQVLRGASDSYGLLKNLSHQYDIAAIGSYKVGDTKIQTAAVFNDGQWYRYDPIKAQPYGAPLENFTPSVAASAGEIKGLTESGSIEWFTGWWSSPRPGTQPNPNFAKEFEDLRLSALKTDAEGFNRGYNSQTPPSITGYSTSLSVEQLKILSLQAGPSAQQLGSLIRRIEDLEELPNTFYTKMENLKALDADSFKQGYKYGTPDSIKGYEEGLRVPELQELALQRGLTTQQMGCLYRQVEKRAITLNLSLAKKFGDNIKAAGGTFVPMPQGLYLSQVSPISGGQCAVFANSMAYAIQEGKQTTLLENLFTVMAHPEHPATQTFQKTMQSFQAKLRHDFHVGQYKQQRTAAQIIEQLANANTSTSLMIGNTTHGITAGVVVKGGDKEWFYFDPNFGLATFKSEASMRAGVESAMSTGSTSALFRPNPGTLTYSVSDFSELNLMNTVGSINGVHDLVAIPLSIPSPRLASSVA
ncbi:hypothetical protein BLL37_15585 [Pseudomonas azotoformans]|uniref:Peptidase C58 YopT-type domain-containing protein n=2 Tax=Pseudomonas azotoformans TaxID=47878 RepID=A0A1V2JHA3_PSEAZ|nr:hypothetical protein BFL39_21540 [Pseudomonas azotoformans]ONH44742.1 hypothetical protein BLL37_15585 [Pseudomonas azotoformans]